VEGRMLADGIDVNGHRLLNYERSASILEASPASRPPGF
jgi:hypothetical protein